MTSKKRRKNSDRQKSPVPSLRSFLEPKNESHFLKDRKNRKIGEVVRKKWYDKKTKDLVKVELSLIVYGSCPGDNDRLFGYDCAHQSQLGSVHRHVEGKIETLAVIPSLSEIVEMFEKEWKQYADPYLNPEKKS
ncbi:MAG: hypothetical protein UBAL2_80490403 [Leptospirillum rubarum]|uniref:Uncharacterized protein n=1 Tax=Leptospirillum sp. Group II '5-way CG' TaxID=419541 RepID=B6AS65_9BACT|nr:MAG: hypothetical protein UBAL2_80490403 [Leptospirillum rubarum]EDZ38317.1 MAG: Hypothetical protein CGL2_11278024 [Leptospirillum sp. Group II '5-way CG']